MEQRHDPKEHEARIFAAEIAREIGRVQRDEPIDALVLVAPPKFLGLLRTELDEGIQKLVVAEIGKNLVESDVKTLERRLPELVQEARS